MQRLLAEPIPRQQQPFLPLVIKCEGKHTAQLLHALRAHLFVKVNNHFRIGVRGKAVAAALQLRAQFGEVIDLSVVNNPNTLVFIEYRLMPPRDVNNAQPPHPQSGPVLDEHTFVVRPAVNNGLTHPMDRLRVDPVPGLRADDSRYSAHYFYPFKTDPFKTGPDNSPDNSCTSGPVLVCICLSR